MSAVHEATIPVEVDGNVYFTANWRRFFLGRPEIEHVDNGHQRPHRRIRLTAVKDPRVLKTLRRKAPKPESAEPEDVADNAVPAMVVAAHVCDAPSEYEKAAAKRAAARRERYGR